MNKVYKIVWNTSLGAWVAVSELAKSKTKTKTKTVGSASLITAMIIFSPNAFAASGIDGGTGTGTSISPNASICNSALGASAANSGTNGANIAIGCNANASGGTRSVVIGDNAAVGSNTSQSVAVGSVAVARGDQSVAMGNNVNANGDSSIAIGGDDINKVRSAYNTSYKTITGVDLPTGYPETTATGGGAVVVGVTAKATGNFSSAFGMAANAIGDASVALGTTANAGGQGALAIGAVSSASNTGSVAIGINSLSSGVNSTAIGSGSTASTGSQAKGDNATAIGAASIAAKSGTALGQSANAADSATAIGIRSSATQAGGVAIGSDSVANTSGSVAGYDPITGQSSTSSTGAWKSTNAAVAVGNGSSVTRQITGVAAGTQDTDAVNIAQLKTTKQYADNLAKSTAVALGGASALDSKTGNISTPTYGITKTDGTTTTVNGVGNAITALNNEVIKPITFQGNNGSTSKALGSTLTISGGASTTTTTSNTNVKTQVSGDGNTIDVQFANAPVFSGAVTASGFNATNNKVTNVADGTVSSTSKDAVNGSQLNTTNNNVTNAQNTANTAVTNAKNAQATADQGISLADNNGKATNKKLGDTFTIKGTGTKADTEYSSGNVKTTTDSDGNLLVNLDKNSTFDSITTGASKLNNDGLTITNGPSITASGGVNAGNKKVLNVSAGDISSSSTDAVNGSQLNITNNNLNDVKNAANATQDTVSKGISLADNNGKATNKKLGDTFTIKGTGTKADTEYSSGNVKTTTDSDGNLLVNLDKNSTFDSITTGASKL
ncbi:ESPR-type extended signal peptide-containing protein, partial [Acinetobacter nectaris]|uniref:ESPR-type extended signal peptide-containing protein n=1 Tax=Acinetobacter nectaris TaxID=1219382 RepID=UPI0023516F35